ncbi:hypothetical protein [Luteibacter rhizovicinus]|uniref:hypothetical protein n=1 Tax=Luteibacter rhizovicinus TaxID=242606 RepID=UPI0010508216|nr:hypothetical protein [Luteibacter rhizovicinus]
MSDQLAGRGGQWPVGPTVGLSLSFSALNTANAGFGRGWSLSTTRYDGRRHVLQLSTGESFRADGRSSGR